MTAAQNKPLLVSKEWLWLYASKKRLPIIGEPQISKESRGGINLPRASRGTDPFPAGQPER